MDGFALLTGSGAIVTTPKHSSCTPIGDGPWLNKLEEVNAPAAAALWKLRNDLAAGSLFPTGLENDMAHLQTFRDANVSMTVSLAAHMTECGRMYWEHRPGAYWCNYGLADSTVRFKIATATKIWDNDVNVDEASLATALNQAAKRRAAGPLPDYEEVIYKAIVALTSDPPKVWKSTDIKRAHCDKMREFLRADFKFAEANYTDWISTDSHGNPV
jgi:hypothetical protein